MSKLFEGCYTLGGPSPFTKCVFPFKYGGVTYSDCAHDQDGMWCSTKTNSSAHHVSGGGHWGTCGLDCPISGNLNISFWGNKEIFGCYL